MELQEKPVEEKQVRINLTLPSSPEQKEKLRVVASGLGYFGQRGASIAHMMDAIADGSAVVTRVDVGAG